MAKINVEDKDIVVIRVNDEDYISLTDMVRNIDNGASLIEKWLRNKNTIEFLGIWEEIYNTDFHKDEHTIIMNEAGLNRFVMSVKQWVNRTEAKGILAKAGRYGGTYAHKDIAFEFATWISPKFKLYLIKEFQKLKEEQRLLGWSAKRELAKVNYKIHTDAIKNNLIPQKLLNEQISFVYANEADVLNVALFGKTAKQWREENPKRKGNMRDYATISELICLSNIENINSVLINDGVVQADRLIKLNKIAIHQMTILAEDNELKVLK